MKQKRTFVTLLLVIALLCLGIAYAAITGTSLNITGTASATANPDNFKVIFSGTPTTDKTNANSNATVSATITDNTNATIACTNLTTKGEYVTATYTIENQSQELGADIVATAECDNDKFTVTTDWTDTVSVATGKTTTITVKITLNETVTEDNVSGNVTVNLAATPVQP